MVFATYFRYGIVNIRKFIDTHTIVYIRYASINLFATFFVSCWKLYGKLFVNDIVWVKPNITK